MSKEEKNILNYLVAVKIQEIEFSNKTKIVAQAQNQKLKLKDWINK